MTTPTIEPAAVSPPLNEAGTSYAQPPYVPPYPGPRVPWYARHPGATATIVIALAAGAAHASGMLFDLLASSERAERQRLIDEGDRAEAEKREASDAAMSLAIAKNGRSIEALGLHQVEATKVTHALLRRLDPAGPSVGLANELSLRQATSALTALRAKQE